MRLDSSAPVLSLLAVGGLLLLVPWELQSWLAAHARLAAGRGDAALAALDDLDSEISERQALRDLVARDLAAAKKNAASLTVSAARCSRGGSRSPRRNGCSPSSGRS